MSGLRCGRAFDRTCRSTVSDPALGRNRSLFGITPFERNRLRLSPHSQNLTTQHL